MKSFLISKLHHTHNSCTFLIQIIERERAKKIFTRWRIVVFSSHLSSAFYFKFAFQTESHEGEAIICIHNSAVNISIVHFSVVMCHSWHEQKKKQKKNHSKRNLKLIWRQNNLIRISSVSFSCNPLFVIAFVH